MLVVFQITLGMDFSWILVEIWLQVGVQNGAKIDIKGGWENYEKMMMARMAKNWKKVVTTARGTTIPDPRGGGRRRGKPLLQGSWRLNGCWVEDFTKVLDHLSPEAGGISLLQIFRNHFFFFQKRPLRENAHMAKYFLAFF